MFRSSKILLIGLALLIPLQSAAKQITQPFVFDESYSRQAVEILKGLSRTHYRQLEINDQFSSDLLDTYIEQFDPTKSYFLKADIESFERYRLTLDDSFIEGDLTPVQTMYNVHHLRITERLQWIISFLQSDKVKFDYTVDEFIDFSYEDHQWPASNTDADERWRKRLKSNLLSIRLADDSEEDGLNTLLKRYEYQLKRVQQDNVDEVFERMMNAAASLYGPHTSYLSPRTLENFNINMSLSLEGIGAVLRFKDDYTEIVRLIQAGPADKQGALKPSDRIVGVAQGVDGDVIDIVGWNLDDVVQLIRGPAGTIVRLAVIPAISADSSSRREILIKRAKVKLEEQAAQKALVELTDGEDIFKVGIIDLPSFYSDFEARRKGDPNYRSTTRDVDALLRELVAEGMDGLVLDLRNNGGGSLTEATSLTDLFVDYGPVVQIREADESVSRNQRSRRRAAYRGPLVVLTNRLSASASEIFAGAIQDYQRGLIVGSQTFGKGTVQSMARMNEGRIKVTSSKFYRVSGDSTQNRGVIPDIQFPFLVDPEEVGESSHERALPWDKIHPVPHDYYFSFDRIVDDIKIKHDERRVIDPDFEFLEAQLRRAKSQKDKKTLSLNEEKRQDEKEAFEAESLKLENKRRLAKGLEIYESIKALRDEQEEKVEESVSEPMKKIDTVNDTLLLESAYILIDMINLLEDDSANGLAHF